MKLLLLSHIIIALSGLVVTTAAYFRPSKALLRTAYTLAGLTLASGTYLTIISPAHIVQTCITGLVYFVFVTFGIVSARKKLAVETVKNQ
jgi:hypothetical protein